MTLSAPGMCLVQDGSIITLHDMKHGMQRVRCEGLTHDLFRNIIDMVGLAEMELFVTL